jgi:hypothetical protein
VIDNFQLCRIPQRFAAAGLEQLVAGFQPAAATHQQGLLGAPFLSGQGLESYLSADAGGIP